jgi:alcohol dehydrogenase class IV
MKTEFFLPTKIIAEPGIFRSLPDLLPVSRGRTAVFTDKGIRQTERAQELLKILEKEGFDPQVYDAVVPNPDEKAAMEATEFIKRSGAQQVVALGGGSSLDTAKIACALAANPGSLEEYQWEGRKFENEPLPLCALPTTSGTGSEVTGVSVITSRNTKKGVLGDAMYPKLTLIDAELTLSLPPRITAHTGMDTLTHAVEAFLGRGASPVSDGFARESIRLTGKNLPLVFTNGDNLEARHEMALASSMAGIAFDQSGLGIVHSLAGPVCADLHIPHGLAMAFLLPFGLEFNREVSTGRIAEIGKLLGAVKEGDSTEKAVEKTIAYVRALRDELDLQPDFDDIVAKFHEHKKASGIDEADFGKRASQMFLMKNNPVHPSADECAELFGRIFAGGE